MVYLCLWNYYCRSGVEEIYSERDHLLQEVSDICKNFKPNGLKRKKTPSKEKQIADLGRLAREQCSLKLKEDKVSLVPEESTSILCGVPQNMLDHDYCKCIIKIHVLAQAS